MRLFGLRRNSAFVAAITVAAFIVPMSAGKADERELPCPSDDGRVAPSEVGGNVNVKACNLVGVVLRAKRLAAIVTVMPSLILRTVGRSSVKSGTIVSTFPQSRAD